MHPVEVLHLVEVDFRENDLLLNTEAEVATAVEACGAHTLEIPRAGQGHIDEAVQEFIHPFATQGHAGTHGHSLPEFEVRNVLRGIRGNGLLTADLTELLDGTVHNLSIGDGLSEALVETDLLNLGHLHGALVFEALLELGYDFLVVLMLESGYVTHQFSG